MNETEIKIREDHERKMGIVIIFTVIAMIVEVYMGKTTKSMSLLAEGYHMGVHVLTLGLTYIAYVLSRKLKNSKHFKKGTYKIGILAGYTSALLLGLTAFEILHESIERFINPETLKYTEALYAAIFALVINFICLMVMEGKFHIHAFEHTDNGEHKDYNFKAAFYHILADVLIAILTIIAIIAGKYLNNSYADIITGMLGAIFIIVWACKLLKHTTIILTDME